MPATSTYSYGKRAYGAIIKEAVAGTPLKPTNYFYFENAGLMTGFRSEIVSPAANTRNLNYFTASGVNDAPTGPITMQLQAASLPFFLTGSFGAPTTSGPVDALYTHYWTSSASSSIPTYTLDLGDVDGGYAFRYVGCRFGNIRFSQKNNVWYVDVTPMARYSFTTAELTANVLALAVSIELDSNYGLTTSDSLVLGYGTANEETVTIASVNVNGTTVGISAAANTHSSGDICVIKNSSPSYSTATNLFSWIGGTTTGIGTTLAGVATQALLEDFTLDLGLALEPRFAPNGTTDYSKYPVEIAVKGYAAKATTKFYHRGFSYLEYLRKRTDIAFDITTTGNLVGTASRDTVELQIPKFRIDPYGIAPGGDNILEEGLTGNCTYSATSGFDVKIFVKNATASY